LLSVFFCQFGLSFVLVMARFLLRRFLLAIFTLFMLSLLIFFATHILPGDVAKKILGNFADADAIKQLNHELGTDRPIPVQYVNWMGKSLRGDLGQSLIYQEPVSSKIRAALGLSWKPALLAFLLVVPVSIFGGVVAALRRGKPTDKLITIGGLSAAVIPEFVWGVVFIVIFGVKLKWLPVAATPPDGASVFVQIKHLLLPALCLVMVLFGYIARITRAGMVESLDADYTRTARLKGLRERRVINRHVLRNALTPTIAVTATQIGYLLGGLIAVENVFNYNGFGALLLNAVRNKDFPLIQACVLFIGMVFVITTLLADVIYTLLNPRIRQAVIG
jgi:peptide/nickel transport system permease protein